ncbi:MAG TPA: sugar ABC transporter substrate-binding protein [Anaerovoracaceae bacterium]|nr:sugar ABC transporter substrate-binding protein [Anaerovoracaceae bacterium]
MKKILALLLVLMMLFSLAACAGSKNGEASKTGNVQNAAETVYTAIPFLEKYKEYKDQGEINVLYLVCTTAAEYFTDSYAVWQPMMEEAGIHMDLMGPPEYSDASLISTLETELASGKYDIVVLYPITPSAITPLLEDIWNTYHVPILSYAFSPNTGSGHYYLGTSYYSCGTVMGKSIVDYVDANSDYFDTLDTIPVAVYMNPQGSEQYQRIQGALDVLEEDGRFSLIQEYAANGEAACLTQTETLLTSHPEVEVILTQIDNDVTGAYQAVTSGVYKPSEYLSLWGFDATGAVCALMSKDGPDGCVQGSTFIDHNQSGEALRELLPILVGAAKQEKLIEFDKEDFDWLGTGLSSYYVTVTPENITKYYTPK